MVNLGSTSVNIISDGTYLRDGGNVFGQIPKSQWEILLKTDRKNRVRLGLNCLLIQSPEGNILVDTGAGAKQPEKLKEQYGLNGNKLLKGLKNLGVTARDIDIVIQTNLHFDHAGGSTKLDRTGNSIPTFPKAKYIVQRSCWNDAINPNERYSKFFYPEDFMPLDEKNQLTLIDGDAEIIPGVNVKVTDGPASGHQIVLVGRGSERFAFASDLIPTPYHLPVEYISAGDACPNNTLEQKKALIDMASREGWLLVFGHANENRIGYVEQRNGRSKLLPIDM